MAALPTPRLGGGYPDGRPAGAPPHAPIVGGGGGVVGSGRSGNGNGGNATNSRDNGNGNNGRGATPVAQSDQPFVANEVITAFAPDTTAQAIDQFARRYDLTQVETQSFPLIGVSLYRWRIGGGRSVAERRQRARQREHRRQRAAELHFHAAGPGRRRRQRRAMRRNMFLPNCRSSRRIRLATGKDVLLAVIDSEIDAKHPDLDGTVVKSFDALGGGETAHLHGTEMAGAIAAHGKLLGIAPGAQILAAHAFDDTAGIAKGTSFAIYKSLQWAADNSARVVNMSFAGPADPTLRRLLAAAYDKGMVLIAAAGNAGPQSEPLYPAADPNVIAVTATDSDDHVFKMANRGRYVAVAAPGVDILALAPDGGYQLSTGTSIAAAHVSGIAALLLERKPSLKPSDIRAILIATAKAARAAGSGFGFRRGPRQCLSRAHLARPQYARRPERKRTSQVVTPSNKLSDAFEPLSTTAVLLYAG